MLRLKIDYLPADHPIHRSRALRNFCNNSDPCLRRALQARQHLVGLCLQSVSRQNRDRFTKSFVAGGTAAPEVVIVERGQVVVNQGIGVQHFQRGASFLDPVGKRPRYGAPCFHAQDRTNALAPGEDAVPHSLMNGCRTLLGTRQKSFERRVCKLTSLFKCFLEHGGEYNKGFRKFERAAHVLSKCASRLKRAPTGALCCGEGLQTYAATVRTLSCRSGATEDRILRVSDEDQQSSAPAVRVRVHISSSATRWLQMM